MNKILILTITMYLLIIFILNTLQPEILYYIDKKKENDKKPIHFGLGKNKQLVCMQTICLILPLLLYLLLFILS
jgi:hypothetical protein